MFGMLNPLKKSFSPLFLQKMELIGFRVL